MIEITLHAADGSFQEQVPAAQIHTLLKLPDNLVLGFVNQRYDFHAYLAVQEAQSS